jgi:hypothetical protein
MTTRSRRKTITADDGPTARMDWMMAAAMIAFGGGLYWPNRENLEIIFTNRDFNPMILLPMILALIGVRFGIKALFATLRQRKYGTSWLDADPLAPRARFTAVLRTTADLEPPTAFKFNLRCIEIAARSRNRRMRWQTTERVAADGLRSSQGIPVTIDVPADAEPPTDRAVGTRWFMVVRASRPGLNYSATFDLNPIAAGFEDDED